MTDHRIDPATQRDPAPSDRSGSRASDVGASALIGGAAAGAVAGTLAGPVGAVIGAAVGAVAAGYAGNAIAESVDRTVEEGHWRENFTHRPYAGPDADFDDFGPAYSYGVDAYVRQPGRSFAEVEPELSSGWSSARRSSRLDWERARPASQDAWQRLSETARRDPKG